jgi:hypothetical protein
LNYFFVLSAYAALEFQIGPRDRRHRNDPGAQAARQARNKPVRTGRHNRARMIDTT